MSFPGEARRALVDFKGVNLLVLDFAIDADFEGVVLVGVAAAAVLEVDFGVRDLAFTLALELIPGDPLDRGVLRAAVEDLIGVLVGVVVVDFLVRGESISFNLRFLGVVVVLSFVVIVAGSSTTIQSSISISNDNGSGEGEGSMRDIGGVKVI